MPKLLSTENLLALLAPTTLEVVLMMLVFAKPVSDFVHRHPAVQMLAFSLLLLVGVFLVAKGLGKHIDRGYIYFAMLFSLFMEFPSMRMRKAAKAI